MNVDAPDNVTVFHRIINDGSKLLVIHTLRQSNNQNNRIYTQLARVVNNLLLNRNKTHSGSGLSVNIFPQTIKLQIKRAQTRIQQLLEIINILSNPQTIRVNLNVAYPRFLCLTNQIRQIIPYRRLATAKLQRIASPRLVSSQKINHLHKLFKRRLINIIRSPSISEANWASHITPVRNVNDAQNRRRFMLWTDPAVKRTTFLCLRVRIL